MKDPLKQSYHVKISDKILKKGMKGKEVGITQRIIEEGYHSLKPLYLELKPAFLHYTLRYSNDLIVRQDAFQEAMIAFYEYCLAGKYDPTKSSPKTLIFRMGRAYLINRLKKEKKILPKETEELDSHITKIMFTQDIFLLDENEEKIKETLLQLGEKCRKLLVYFFYHNFRVEVIMERMDYKNLNTVSSHKSRCLKQLKRIIQEKS